jgi:sterol desaturase/sphingolipid hydroxylase (fatty acid hydroxylase superfamily)
MLSWVFQLRISNVFMGGLTHTDLQRNTYRRLLVEVMWPAEEVSPNFETNEAALMMSLGVIFSFS